MVFKYHSYNYRSERDLGNSIHSWITIEMCMHNTFYINKTQQGLLFQKGIKIRLLYLNGIKHYSKHNSIIAREVITSS